MAFERERVTTSLTEGLGLRTGVPSAAVDVQNFADTFPLGNSRLYLDRVGGWSGS